MSSEAEQANCPNVTTSHHGGRDHNDSDNDEGKLFKMGLINVCSCLHTIKLTFIGIFVSKVLVLRCRFRCPVGSEIFSSPSCSDRFCGPFTLLCDGTGAQSSSITRGLIFRPISLAQYVFTASFFTKGFLFSSTSQ
jgi:hypothetical protein